MKDKICGILIVIFVIFSVSLVETIQFADATEISVNPGNFTQFVINNATSGDVINFAPGTYNISSPIVINKPLTLLGPQADNDPRPSVGTTRIIGEITSEAIIDGRVTVGELIQVDADNVTINGFEIKNGTGDLIKSEGDVILNPTIRYNIIHTSSGDEGIQLKDVDNALVEFNHVYDTFGDAINIARSHDSTIQFNEIHDIDSPDAAIYVYNDGLRDFINVVIQNNLVYDIHQNDGIKLGDKGGSDQFLSGGHILNNVIHDTRQDGITIYASDTLVSGNEVYNSASENGAIYVSWNADNITISNNNIHDNKKSSDDGPPPFDDPATTYGIRIGKVTFPTNVIVNDNIIQDNEAGLFYNFQIDNPSLDAINNYWGHVKGPKHFNNSQGNGDTITDNVLFDPWHIDSESVFLSADILPVDRITVLVDDDLQDIIDNVDAGSTLELPSGSHDIGDVTITKSITLISDTGDYKTTGTILTGASGFKITGDADDVTIKGFKFENLNGSSFSAVVHVSPVTGETVENILIEKNSFNNIPVHAVKINKDNNNVVINNNKITNVGAAFPFTGNVHSGIAALQMFNPTNLKITNNIIDTATQAGINLSRMNGTVIDGNTISNTDSSGINICCSQAEGNIIRDNTITNTNIDSSSPDKGGISLYRDTDGILITGNTLKENKNGLTIRNAFSSANDVTFFANDYVVTNNKFIDNNGLQIGIFTNDARTIDANKNWFGDKTGPTNSTANTDGLGGTVSDNILFVPWYFNSALGVLSDEVSTEPGNDKKITTKSKKVKLDDGNDTTKVKGQAALPKDIVEIELNNDAVLDVNDNIEEKVGDNIDIGGVIVTLTTFEIQTDDDGTATSTPKDLTKIQKVANVDIQVEKAVKLESGTDTEPIIITNSDLPTVKVSIPDETTILAPAGWTGTIQPPKAASNSGTAPSGFSVGDTVIEVGSSDAVLLFDTPVTLTLEGVTGAVGYKPAGSTVWTQITESCGGTFDNPDAPSAFPGECFISNESDTKIVTYHFTEFGELDSTPPPAESSPAKSSSGGSGRINVSPQEMDKKSSISLSRVGDWVSSKDYFKIGIRDLISQGYIENVSTIPTESPPEWFYSTGQAWKDDKITDEEYFNAVKYLIDHKILK